MTTYTTELKEKLSVDIRYIDGQLDLARERTAAGDKEEAWAKFMVIIPIVTLQHPKDVLLRLDGLEKK